MLHFRAERHVWFDEQNDSFYCFMSVLNAAGDSQFRDYAAFYSEAGKVCNQLENNSNQAPIIIDLETLGLISLFKSLSGKLLTMMLKRKINSTSSL